VSVRTDFPVFPAGLTHAMAAGAQPVMLDGMEVLFDKLVGLAPVTLVEKPGVSRRNGRAAGEANG
jgi:hypothetical protein